MVSIAPVAASAQDRAPAVSEHRQAAVYFREVLRSLGDRAQGVRILGVKASKGKLARAEPIYSLYQEGRVFHVGAFPMLETQMVSFNPEHMAQSPDRVDALVWGLSAALLTGGGAFVV